MGPDPRPPDLIPGDERSESRRFWAGVLGFLGFFAVLAVIGAVVSLYLARMVQRP